jgi:hypothetical protein
MLAKNLPEMPSPLISNDFRRRGIKPENADRGGASDVGRDNL